MQRLTHHLILRIVPLNTVTDMLIAYSRIDYDIVLVDIRIVVNSYLLSSLRLSVKCNHLYYVSIDIEH